jgi:hypothetical protein
MTVLELVEILKAGGVVTVDGHDWSVDRAHSEDDMPAILREPLDENELDDEWLERQCAWWATLEVCKSENAESSVLIQALCKIAGVRVRGA